MPFKNGGKTFQTHSFVSEIAVTVSTGGNVLINVGPTQHGLIQPIFVERLRTMGNWLKLNGEAIYSSHPWIYQNDTKTPDVWYTSKIQSNDRIIVYAIVLQYPYESSSIKLYSLGGKSDAHTDVKMLGYPKSLKVSRRKCFSSSLVLLLLGKVFGFLFIFLFFYFSFQWNGSDESMDIQFPDKAQTDKIGIHLAWTIAINIPNNTVKTNNLI